MEPRIITLLAFVAITVLTALAVLGAALGYFPNANEKLITWGIPAVLGEIVISVIIYFKTQWTQPIRINLDFGNAQPEEMDLDSSLCQYSISDRSGTVVNEGKIGTSLGPGGWQVELPVQVRPGDSIELLLKTTRGESWLVRRFLPFIQTKTPIKIEN